MHGIYQARVLEWLLFPSPGNLPNPGIEPGSPTLQADAFTVWATRKTHLLDTLNKITLFPRALYTWICVDNNNNSKHYVASFIGHFSKCLHNSSFNTYNNNMSWVLFYSPVYSKENEVPRNKIYWKTPIGSELKSDTKKSGSRTHVLITVWYLSTFSLVKKYERSLIFWWGKDDFQENGMMLSWYLFVIHQINQKLNMKIIIL